MCVHAMIHEKGAGVWTRSFGRFLPLAAAV